VFIVFGGFIFGVLERTAVFPYIQNTIDARIQITERIAQRIVEKELRNLGAPVSDVTYMSAGEQMWSRDPEGAWEMSFGCMLLSRLIGRATYTKLMYSFMRIPAIFSFKNYSTLPETVNKHCRYL